MPVDRQSSQDFLEVERIDPEAFTNPPPMPRTEQRLEPVPPPPPAQPQQRPTSPLPKTLDAQNLPKKPPEPIDAVVTASVVKRLIKRFGVVQEALIEQDLQVYGETMQVSLRLPTYDDFMWAMAMIERKVRSQEDSSMLMTEIQRNEMLQAYVSCRTVVRLDGQYVWDAFGVTDQIKKLVPGWDGVDRTKVPDFYQGTLTVSVMGLFRQLHPELLFALTKAVRQLDVEQAKKRAEPEPEDPTSAP